MCIRDSLLTVSPLKILPWHDPFVQIVEREKWLNTDTMRELFRQFPELEQVASMHFEELKLKVAPPPEEGPPPPPPPGGNAPGNGQALATSNRNSTTPSPGVGLAQ